MNNKIVSLLILIVLVVGLIVTNPNRNDYFNYIDNEYSKNANNVSGLKRLVVGLGHGVLKTQIKATTERHNFIVFSTYTSRAGNKDIMAIGILKFFISF